MKPQKHSGMAKLLVLIKESRKRPVKDQVKIYTFVERSQEFMEVYGIWSPRLQWFVLRETNQF